MTSPTSPEPKSKTPRTDAFVAELEVYVGRLGPIAYQVADFARALETEVEALREAAQALDQQIAALFWTTDDGKNMRDGKPEDADAPKEFCKAWEAMRTLTQPTSTEPTNEKLTHEAGAKDV